MIRKTKKNKQLIRRYHGQLEMKEFATYDDVLRKLYYYEEMERNELIMEVADSGWIKCSYNNRYMCDHCGSITEVPLIEGNPGYKFCPYCNARMKGRIYK